MNNTRRLPEPERVVATFEVQIRNFIAVQRHASRALDTVEASHSALVSDLRERIMLCDHEALLDSVSRLRAALDVAHGD